ncbi:hypothetical protein AVEN_224794-1 [Araneus ventricosus]|uniref:Uncharacterized protein n=1 Tax=Araneus ventricosus TaxID=182803 RepID=A0A4Y2X273_ARAVE|nr:hypothetical protein AVEN_224794-1 [Araneus ventricosus]
MPKLLVEIQASHVGIGKTTFAQKLNYPWVDDCINLVESDPAFYYESKRNVFKSDTDNEILRAHLVLENATAMLDLRPIVVRFG